MQGFFQVLGVFPIHPKLIPDHCAPTRRRSHSQHLATSPPPQPAGEGVIIKCKSALTQCQSSSSQPPQYKRIRLLKSDHIKDINLCKGWMKQQLAEGKGSQRFLF